MTQDSAPLPSGPDAEEVAQRLGLAVVAEATALHADDDEAVAAAEENLRETVDELIDDPLTHRQEEVVDALAASSASIAAGLAGVVASEQDKPVDEVLQAAARSLVMPTHHDDLH